MANRMLVGLLPYVVPVLKALLDNAEGVLAALADDPKGLSAEDFGTADIQAKEAADASLARAQNIRPQNYAAPGEAPAAPGEAPAAPAFVPCHLCTTPDACAIEGCYEGYGKGGAAPEGFSNPPSPFLLHVYDTSKPPFTCGPSLVDTY